MKEKIITFSSSSGNQYVYDDNSGQIFHIAKDNDLSDVNRFSKEIGVYNQPLIKKITTEQIDSFIYSNGFKQLQLEVTTGCNLRCKYCCFSDCYEYTRSHGQDLMTWETAKEAIDYYYDNLAVIRKRNPERNACVSFYGGEPLINFYLIKKVVEYIRETYGEFHTDYNITTNCTLLTEEIGDFFVENNFAILVSLDGDEINHNRNRVFQDGRGSFETVTKNLFRFRQRHPEHLKLAISACFELSTDFDAVETFFDENKLFVAKHSFIDQTNTTFFNQYSKEDWERFQARYKKFKEKYIFSNQEIKKDRFLANAVGVGYMEFAFHMMFGDRRNEITPYTGTCVPGEKLYVAVDGRIHMCEKVNPRYSIGDIKEKGLDLEKIKKVVDEYNQVVGTHCSDCQCTKLCNLCFKTFGGEEGFVYNENICEGVRDHVRQTLTEYVDILERRPAEVEKITGEYFSNIIEIVGEGC